MPPSALRLMIVQLAVHSTFRARPTRQLLVGQMDVDLSVGQLQLNRLDVPRRLDPENALIKVSILHSQNCLTPFSATAQNPLQSRNSPLSRRSDNLGSRVGRGQDCRRPATFNSQPPVDH